MSPVERIPPTNLDELLRVVLADPGAGRAADRARLRGFQRHLSASGALPAGFAVRRGGRLSGAAVTLRLAGRTALLLAANPGEHGIELGDQIATVQDALADSSRANLHYIQALAEPTATAKAAAYAAAAFRRLTLLNYLERDARHPWVEPPEPAAAHWLAYAAETEASFAATVHATYSGSCDCPEIGPLRPIDDVLAGHRAAGRFDPRLWELALVADAPAGCILLSEVGDDLLEVVYMGVVPAWRGRGVGDLLLRRALWHARARRRARVTLVVDERNAPALRAYARLQFRSVAERVVYLHTPALRC